MRKYRVLKSYPKQITNSGRLVRLVPGKSVYLKSEAQVIRLVNMGFLKPVVELPNKIKKKPKKVEVKEVKSEYKDKKKKGKSDSAEKDDL